MEFSKATRADGVDGHFTTNMNRVIVKPSEFPEPLRLGDAGFWDQFLATIKAVSLAKDRAVLVRGTADCLPVKFAHEAAELVHMDRPTEIMTYAAANISSPFREFTSLSRSSFTDKLVLLDSLMAQAAHAVSPSSFCAKWKFILARPEEIAGAIARGEISAPDMIVMALQEVESFDVLAADQRKFTMYPEGCPMHPSYNAMHAAAAGAACTVLKVMYDLSDHDRREVDMCAHNMAHFRSNAGVHYPQDNSVGLWLGQEVVTRWLPDVLADLGANKTEVNNAIEAAQTEWL